MMAKKQWKEMTREEKKVAVCKDVLKQIQLQKIRPHRGNYFAANNGRRSYFDRVGPKEVEQSLASTCEACAKGALMASKLLISESSIEVNGSVADEETTKALKGVFSLDELETIEVAFEKWKDWDEVAGEYVETPEYLFGAQFEHDEDRLIAIMQNIIDHKGTFRPEVQYEIVWR